MVQHFEARLLDPLQYHSFVDTGASGATVTAPFLGDIALAFAINASVLAVPLPERRWVHGKQASGPDYKTDLHQIGLFLTVGEPIDSVNMLQPEYQASSYMGEGFEQRNISSGASYNQQKKWREYSSVASSSWRPWRQAQSMAPGNRFTFSVLRGERLPEKFAIRMGNGRSCLIEVSETKSPEKVTLNEWTAKNIHGLDLAHLPFDQRETPLAQYSLLRGVPLNVVIEVIK